MGYATTTTTIAAASMTVVIVVPTRSKVANSTIIIAHGVNAKKKRSWTRQNKVAKERAVQRISRETAYATTTTTIAAASMTVVIVVKKRSKVANSTRVIAKHVNANQRRSKTISS